MKHSKNAPGWDNYCLEVLQNEAFPVMSILLYRVLSLPASHSKHCPVCLAVIPAGIQRSNKLSRSLGQLWFTEARGNFWQLPSNQPGGSCGFTVFCLHFPSSQCPSYTLVILKLESLPTNSTSSLLVLAAKEGGFSSPGSPGWLWHEGTQGLWSPGSAEREKGHAFLPESEDRGWAHRRVLTDGPKGGRGVGLELQAWGPPCHSPWLHTTLLMCFSFFSASKYNSLWSASNAVPVQDFSFSALKKIPWPL